MVKVGIIGCGKIAQVRHIPEYLDNPNAKLTGLYDLNLQRAKDLAEKYNCKSYESVEEMLADPEIDAVSVCVANHVHAEITIAALKAGKHVLCEKPMATKLEDCQMMVDTAEQMGKKLMIGQIRDLPKLMQKQENSSNMEISVRFLLSKQHSDMAARKPGA